MNLGVKAPWDVITRLYALEINAGMQTDWDGGIVVWIGGPAYADLGALPESNITHRSIDAPLSTVFNPILSKASFAADEFDRVAEWMDREAQRLFPGKYK